MAGRCTNRWWTTWAEVFGNCDPACRIVLRAPCSSSPKERLWCFTVSLKRRRRRQHRSSAWPGGENANTNIMSKNKHRGSDLRDLLREDGVLEAVEARAVKRALALKLGRLAAEQSLSKSEMAARMKTSRA